MAEEVKPNNEVDYKALYEQSQADYTKLKTNFDKASSEIADFKRKDRERMSEEEKKQAEWQEREAYYKELERKNALREYADELGDIFDAKQREKISTMFADGDVLGGLREFKVWRDKQTAEIEKRIKAELLKNQPEPTPQGQTTRKTKEEILAVSDSIERQRLIAENIDLFR